MARNKMNDEDFEDLLEEMDEVGRQADVLHDRISKLIDDMQAHLPDEEPEDTEQKIEGHES